MAPALVCQNLVRSQLKRVGQVSDFHQTLSEPGSVDKILNNKRKNQLKAFCIEIEGKYQIIFVGEKALISKRSAQLGFKNSIDSDKG